MNNNELMDYLSIVSKNHSQRNQIMLFGTITAISLAICCIVYSKYQRVKKQLNQLKQQNYFDQEYMAMQDDQINEKENTINQLIYEMRIKANHTPTVSPSTE